MSENDKVLRRYSDDELDEFKSIIEEKLCLARKNLDMLLDSINVTR